MYRHLIIFILLSLFLSPLRAQQSAMRKLSPTVRMLVFSHASEVEKARKAQRKVKDRQLCTFVKVTDDAVIGSYHAQDLASFGDIHIVSIPVSRISDFASDHRVLRVETGRGTSVQMDTVPRILNALPVYEGQNIPQVFTGRDVVVGVQDIGFDLTNPNFYSSDLSEYRIKAFWDMLSVDTIGSQMYVGQEYRGREALLEYAHSRDGLKQGHGCHTLGIAAGSGFGSPYRGLAWESDICLVSNAVSDDLEFISDEDLGKFTYAADALGFKYIFDYAESVGKPCVINFSEGSRQDLYGDDILYFEVLKRLTGPGRIIVSSAGNNNLEPSYIHKPIGRESAGTFLEKWGNYLYFMTSADKADSTRLVFYGEKNDTLTYSSEWLCQQPDSLVYDTLKLAGKEYRLAIGAYPSCYDANRLVVEYYIQGDDRIGVYNPISAEVIGREADIEMYKMSGNFVSKSLNPQLCDAECTHDINSPSAADAVICVGATVYRPDMINIVGDTIHTGAVGIGLRTTYSSVGPALDGRMKPDVVAPGSNIISSYNSFYFEANPDSRLNGDVIARYEYNGRNYVWKADSGTSMSSPAVAGAVALWLQAKPDLTKDEIMDVFAHTCTHPDSDLEYPNNEYGYGQIDVYRGLLYLLGLDGITEISCHQPSVVTFSLHQNQLTVAFPEPLKKPASIALYTTEGKRLLKADVPAGNQQAVLLIPSNIKGIIAAQVNGNTSQSTGSTLLRLR